MDWFQLLQLLQLLQNSLPEPNPLELPIAPVPDDELRALFESVERTHREDTDAAARAFSRSGKLPELSTNERYFLVRRIEFAVWVLLALNAPGEQSDCSIVPAPPRHWGQEDQVEWMLIWAWRTPGWKVWLEKTVASELLARRKL